MQKEKSKDKFLNDIRNIWYEIIIMFFPNMDAESNIEYEIDTYLDTQFFKYKIFKGRKKIFQRL